MGKGRKKIPTKLKAAKGTLQPCRTVSNEMEVSPVVSMPEAPAFLNSYGVSEWNKVTNELANLQMLHDVDLGILSAYCREIGVYVEMVSELKGGQTYIIRSKEGFVVAEKAKPEVKISRDSLDRALKLAVQFGFTPSARASISAPDKKEKANDNYNFF